MKKKLKLIKCVDVLQIKVRDAIKYIQFCNVNELMKLIDYSIKILSIEQLKKTFYLKLKIVLISHICFKTFSQHQSEA